MTHNQKPDIQKILEALKEAEEDREHLEAVRRDVYLKSANLYYKSRPYLMTSRIANYLSKLSDEQNRYNIKYNWKAE